MVPVLRDKWKLLTSGKGKGGETMKRTLTVLMLAMVVMAVMAVTVGSAFAQSDRAGFTTKNPGGQEQGCGGNNPNCETTNRGGNAPPGQQ